MERHRWEQIERLYHAALEREPGAREAFLDEACAGDETLRREVAGLLAYDIQSDSFIQSPAIEIAAKALAAEPLIEASIKPTESLNAASQISVYQLISPLGRGGMGEVYLALDTRLGRKVALKLLPAEFTTNTSRVKRFAWEARAVSALNHPNIITIHEIGETATENRSLRYIVTEYVEGETLRQQMESAPQRRMTPSEAIEVAAQIAAALAAAHEAGITHRDIKPENVMVRRDGIVKVLDFGLAMLTETQAAPVESHASTIAKLNTEAGVVMGTPRYMSPEQARGDKVDARTDIFSLGVMLYEMVAGRALFAGATTGEVIASILRDDPPPLTECAPAAPPELERIVGQALRKNCAERYQNAAELLTDLHQLSRAREFTAEEIERSGQAKVEGGTLKKRGLAAACALLLLAFADVGLYLRAKPARRAESLAVLPFDADTNTEYLSDGITESLINNLSRLPNLCVIARATAFRYKGREISPRQVGQELDVRAVLTGKVTLRDDTLIVQVELVDAGAGTQMWGDRYRRKLSDIFGVQEEISSQIAEKLRLRLNGEAQRQLTKHHTENQQAYQLFLKGRYRWDQDTPAGRQKAVASFQHALAEDPRYALACSWLAAVYIHLGIYGEVLHHEAKTKAQNYALRALELDETQDLAHYALGAVKLFYEWDAVGADRELKRAIDLNPNNVDGRLVYAYYLLFVGRTEEAVAEVKRGQQLDFIWKLPNRRKQSLK